MCAGAGVSHAQAQRVVARSSLQPHQRLALLSEERTTSLDTAVHTHVTMPSSTSRRDNSGGRYVAGPTIQATGRVWCMTLSANRSVTASPSEIGWSLAAFLFVRGLLASTHRLCGRRAEISADGDVHVMGICIPFGRTSMGRLGDRHAKEDEMALERWSQSQGLTPLRDAVARPSQLSRVRCTRLFEPKLASR